MTSDEREDRACMCFFIGTGRVEKRDIVFALQCTRREPRIQDPAGELLSIWTNRGLAMR